MASSNTRNTLKWDDAAGSKPRRRVGEDAVACVSGKSIHSSVAGLQTK